jgi:nucleoside-diphosphate-sugar epimerase
VTRALTGVRTVVTGSAGFIGAHLVRELIGRGAEVVGLDRRYPSDDLPGTHFTVELTGSLDRSTVADALRDADMVFHLAGRGGVRDVGPEVALARRRDNAGAAANVLALTGLDVPLVVTSSSSVYGGARPSRDGRLRPSREDDLRLPLGDYARSKTAVEDQCAIRADRGGAVVVARPFTVTGPGQRPDMAVARWLTATLAGTPIEVLGSLERSRDVTDVRDVARALADLAAQPHGLVNLGTGRSVRLGDLLGAVVEAAGRPAAIESAPAPAGDPSATLADTTRLAARIGWVPVTDVRAVVRDQLAALRQREAHLHSRVESANMG